MHIIRAAQMTVLGVEWLARLIHMRCLEQSWSNDPGKSAPTLETVRAAVQEARAFGLTEYPAIAKAVILSFDSHYDLGIRVRQALALDEISDPNRAIEWLVDEYFSSAQADVTILRVLCAGDYYVG